MTYKILTDDTVRLFIVQTFARRVIRLRKTYAWILSMTNLLKLSGLYEIFLPHRIMGRSDHSRTGGEIPERIWDKHRMRLSTLRNLSAAPSSWTPVMTGNVSVPASSNASEHEDDRVQEHVQFRISVNDDEYEEIITYNELMDLSRRTGK